MKRLVSPFKHSLNYKQLKGPESLKLNLRNRKMTADVDLVSQLFERHQSLSFELNQLNKERNQIANLMKQSKTKDVSLINSGKKLKHQLQEMQVALKTVQDQLYEEACHLPNTIHPTVPIGDETKADCLFTSRSLPRFDFTPKDHIELAKEYDLLDIERAGKVSGSRSYYLKNAGALLELGLARYAFDQCIQHGFTPVMVPDIIRYSVLKGCGFAPRSNDPQTYFLSTIQETTPDDPLCLAATAEFPLAVFLFDLGYVCK